MTMRRHTRIIVALTGALPVLLATLYPTSAVGSSEWFVCFVCGERGLADVIVNILLFIPLGAAISAVFAPQPLVRVLLSASALSLGVEVAQSVIPGRYASVVDLAFNTTGAVVGSIIYVKRASWLSPGPRVSRRLALLASVCTAAVLVLTGVLLTRHYPDTDYYVQWTPQLKHLGVYQGKVLSAAVGGEPLLPGVNDAVRRFVAGRDLTVRAIAGPPPGQVSPLISVYDGDKREILLLAVMGNDLVLRERVRASVLRLDKPSLLMRGAFAGVRPGDELIMTVRRSAGGELCIEIAGSTRCDVGYSIASGWSLLLYADEFPQRLMESLDRVWLILLAVPIGFWLRGGRGATAAVGLLVLAAFAVPRATPLLATSPIEYLLLGTGMVSGWAVANMTGIRSKRAEPHITSTSPSPERLTR
jgi:hypothetical protein